MKVVVARNAGFCFGVKRAVDMALKATEEVAGPISSLGPIIHSPQMVQTLEDKGVRVCHDLGEIAGGAVIVRSHGVTRIEAEEMESRGLEVIDTTCPFVKKAQEYAARLSAEGYGLIIVGEKDHPEVQGILSYGTEGRVWVVASAEEVEQVGKMSRVAVIAQTTQSEENLAQVVQAALQRFRELRVFNTICNATSVRQKEASQLAAEVELVIVVGGRSSANTSRLAKICAAIQPKTYHIETAEELEPRWFNGVTSVGVTAGASTPASVIDAVVAAVQQFET